MSVTSKQPITIDRVCELTHAAKSTVYQWVHSGKIPFHKPRQGKRLLFFEDEIIAWIKNGRRLTLNELTQQADESVAQRRSRRNGRSH